MPVEEYLPLLKRLHLFKGLTDDQILTAAGELTVESYPAEAVIFKEGDEGQLFYILKRGQVTVTRRGPKGETRKVATLVAGDYFGEAALMYGRRRSATITATTDVVCLCLSKADFDNLLKRYPQIKPNLLVSTESRDLYRRLKFTWLTPTEVVYLIARRHKILLWQSLVVPIGLSSLLVIVTLFLSLYLNWQLALAVLAAGGLPLAGWIWWLVVDWGNDFYIVTNRRVVYLEKIIGIYDSRQESPLASILSVNVQTAGPMDRALGMGDVIVRTFSGPIVMKSVANPQVLAAMVEEHWNRIKTSEREAELDAMRRSLRQRLRPEPEPPKQETPPPPPPKPPSLGAQLARLFTFQLRYEQDGSIIYRKHWYLLVQDIWLPSALIVALFALPVALGLLNILPAALPLVILVAFVLFIPLAGWWLYEYVDWKNDVYQVTADQIVDINRKPFGTEVRKAAPLGNILSLKYERPGLLGMLLNYGTVSATVGGTEIKFDGVFDPLGVQNDIYRRMEALNAKKAQSETVRRRDEISEWLSAYHVVVNELDDEDKKGN